MEERAHRTQSTPSALGAPASRADDRTFRKRLLLVLEVAVLVFLAWKVRETLILGLLGVLFALLLHGIAQRLAPLLRMSQRAGVAIVIASLLVVVGLFAWFAAAPLAAQFNQMAQELPSALDQLEERLRGSEWGRALVGTEGRSFDVAGVVGRIATWASTGLVAMGALVLVLFVGIYLALDPGRYREGFLQFVAPHRRRRIGRVMDRVGQELWAWILARSLSMLLVAILTWIGLAALGIQLAFVLAVLAGALTFIPYAGPVLSSAPAILLAYQQEGMQLAVMTAGLYVVVQLVEGNILIPLILQTGVQVPAAVVLLALVGFGTLFGFLGMLVATPLVIVTRVVLRAMEPWREVDDPDEEPDEEAAGEPAAPEHLLR